MNNVKFTIHKSVPIKQIMKKPVTGNIYIEFPKRKKKIGASKKKRFHYHSTKDTLIRNSFIMKTPSQTTMAGLSSANILLN